MAWGVDCTQRADCPPGNGCGCTLQSCQCPFPAPSGSRLADWVGNGGSTPPNPPVWSPGLVTFWCRYFSPVGTSGACAVDQEPYFNRELAAMLDNGINYMVPICTPGPRTGLDYAAGWADAGTMCAGIVQVVSLSGSPSIGGIIIKISTNPQLSCVTYLNVEGTQALSQAYWNGFADRCRNYQYTAPNGVIWNPFYPAAYINPNNDSYCSTLCANSKTAGLWSNQPSGYTCTFPGPAWPPTNCACGGPNYARLWQFSLNSSCGYHGVDYDESTSAWDEEVNMIAFYYPGSPCRTCR
jgi:hypothetical protein